MTPSSRAQGRRGVPLASASSREEHEPVWGGHGRQLGTGEEAARLPLWSLGLSLLAGVSWLLAPQTVAWWPLALLLPAWAWRLRDPTVTWSRLDVAVVVFLASALVGVWTAYDREQAWLKWRMLLAAVALCHVTAGQPRSRLWAVMGVWTGAASVVAWYFLLTHDWRATPAEYPPLTNAGLAWMAIRPALPWPALDAGVVDGIIGMFLPVGLLAALELWSRRRWGPRLVAAGLVGTLFAAWLLTSSPGSWLAIGAAATGVWWWQASHRLATSPRRGDRLFWTGVGLPVVVGLVAWLGLPSLVGPVVEAWASQAEGVSRVQLAGQTVDLIRDYRWTGSGLSSYAGQYAQYIRGVPSFFLGHGHNLFLDVWLEQGPLGLATWLSILLLVGRAWLASSRAAPPLDRAGLALGMGLVVLVVHGLVDDPLYGGPATPFLLAIPGLIAASAPAGHDRNGRHVALLPAAVAVIVTGTTCLLGGAIRSGWHANLGALQLARVELAGWPSGEWDLGDDPARVAPARRTLQRALALDPSHRTARHRLGLIAMRTRDHAQAVAHLEIALAQARRHRGILKTLGYGYVWTGDLGAARDLLDAIPESNQELTIYASWWRQRGRDDLAALARQMTQTESTGTPRDQLGARGLR